MPGRSTCALVALAAQALLTPRPIAAENATLLADLAPGTLDGAPEMHAAVYDGKLYFRGSEDGTTFDLWVYDGAGAPEVVPGGEGLDPRFPVVWQDELYFRGTGAEGSELWRYDAASPPELALDIRTGPASGNPQRLFAWGSRLCFQTSRAEGDVELGCWDGDGVADVFNLGSGLVSGAPTDFAIFGSKLVFASHVGVSTRRLHVYDGASAPSVILFDANHPHNPSEMTVADGLLYFWASAPGANARFWKWDGTAAPPQPFGLANISFPGGVAMFRGRPHARLGQGAYGIWRVDENDVVQLAEAIITPSNLDVPATDGALYYVSGSDFRRFCGGEEAGAVMGSQFGPGDGPREGRHVQFGGRLYFVARANTTTGDEIWSLPLGTLFCDGFAEAGFPFWSATVP
jgi:ELWxxDGT repeat protein